MKKIEYKFREDEILEELKQSVDKTYTTHYAISDSKRQSLEHIIDMDCGLEFIRGSIDKYNHRYGKKGESFEEYRKDLIKIAHYAILAVYEHDRRQSIQKEKATMQRIQCRENAFLSEEVETRCLDDVTPEEWNNSFSVSAKENSKNE